jgi:lysophosphatidic acid acyltransferase/lysophosphatidylinositol acyltransferase
MLAFTKDSATPTFRTLLKGQSCQAQLYVKRIPITQIPYQDEAECAQWLHKLFQEKVIFHRNNISFDLIYSGSYLRLFYST